MAQCGQQENGFHDFGFGALKFYNVKVRNRYTKYILLKGEIKKILQKEELPENQILNFISSLQNHPYF
jgi:hypothetical protein